MRVCVSHRIGNIDAAVGQTLHLVSKDQNKKKNKQKNPRMKLLIPGVCVWGGGGLNFVGLTNSSQKMVKQVLAKVLKPSVPWLWKEGCGTWISLLEDTLPNLV